MKIEHAGLSIGEAPAYEIKKAASFALSASGKPKSAAASAATASSASPHTVSRFLVQAAVQATEGVDVSSGGMPVTSGCVCIRNAEVGGSTPLRSTTAFNSLS